MCESKDEYITNKAPVHASAGVALPFIHRVLVACLRQYEMLPEFSLASKMRLLHKSMESKQLRIQLTGAHAEHLLEIGNTTHMKPNGQFSQCLV